MNPQEPFIYSFADIAMAQDLYLTEHLSMYASEVMDSLQSFPKSSNDEDDWEMSDNEELDMNDSEDIRDGDIVFMETDEDEEEEDIHNLPHAGEASLVKRIPLGPPQDTDVKPLKTTPPQLILSRAENTLHKLTFGLSMDKLYHTTLAAGRHIGHPSVQESPAPDSSDGNRRRRKRMPFDDYDKRLGLRTRSKNPVVQITSSFLGPLMRMFRVFVVATRVVFNIGIWKDPFLSFWVLCFLLALMFILVIFPWRYFMFLVGLVCFGPQVRTGCQCFNRSCLVMTSNSLSSHIICHSSELARATRATETGRCTRKRNGEESGGGNVESRPSRR